jgi:16S rRNA U1498 N3-methylase RsmE
MRPSGRGRSVLRAETAIGVAAGVAATASGGATRQ